VAYNELATAYLLLDLIPGPEGVAGQLVFNINESDVVVLEDGLVAYFDRLKRMLEAKRVRIEPQPSEHGDRLWFTSEGHPVDGATYLRLKASQ
jgi:hypothetical protein